jgi:hypothetical protein
MRKQKQLNKGTFMPDIKPTTQAPAKPELNDADYQEQGTAAAPQRPDLVRLGFGTQLDLDFNFLPELTVSLLPPLWRIEGLPLPIQGFVEVAASGTNPKNAQIELRHPISLLDPKLFSIDIIPYVAAPLDDLTNPDAGVGLGGRMKLYGLLSGFLSVYPLSTSEVTRFGGGLSLDF